MAHFDVTAPAFGLGTCWAGLVAAAAVSDPSVREVIGVPAGRRVGYAMMFGLFASCHTGLQREKPLRIASK